MSDRWIANLIALAAFVAAIVLGVLSDGVHHDDDLAHFLMARWARVFPEYLLHFWARPGFTLPHAAVAWIGSTATAWTLCRMLSAGCTLASTLLAIRVADRLNVRPLWAVSLACTAQPIAMLLSYTTLVENVAGLYVVAGVAALVSGRPVLGSLLLSPALITRYDAAVLLPVWWLAVASHDLQIGRRLHPSERDTRRPPSLRRRIVAAVACLWAPMLHQALLVVLLDANPLAAFSSPRGSSQYTPAGPFVFLPQFFLAIPPVLAALAVVGGTRLVAAGRWLVPAMAGVFTAAHVLLRSSGLYASGGFARFLVTVSPLVAILIAAGLPGAATSGAWSRSESYLQFSRRRSLWLTTAAAFALVAATIWLEHRAGRLPMPDPRIFIAAVACSLALCGLSLAMAASARAPARPGLMKIGVFLLFLTIAGQFFAIVRPMRLAADPRHVRDVLTWIDANQLGERPIFAATPWVSYFRHFAEHPRLRKSARLLASMPPGTLVLWDPVYCPSDYHRLPLEALENNPAYRLTGEFEASSSAARPLRLFEKVIETPIPESEPPPYPPDILPPAEPRGWYYVRLPS